jgi:hypothetical protein
MLCKALGQWHKQNVGITLAAASGSTLILVTPSTSDLTYHFITRAPGTLVVQDYDNIHEGRIN